MPHCLGQIQHPHLGYLSHCRMPEKQEEHLPTQTTHHQSISGRTCVFKLSGMRVFLSTDALSHNPFIFELLVAWGEPVLPLGVVTQKQLLLVGSVVPSPVVLVFGGGCLSHVMLPTRMCFNVLILHFYHLACVLTRSVLPLCKVRWLEDYCSKSSSTRYFN